MSIDFKKLAQYATEPMSFWLDLNAPTSHGVQPFSKIIEPFQREWLESTAPSIVALAHGRIADRRKFFCEGSKGCGKEFFLGLIDIWLHMFARTALTIQVAADDFDQASEMPKEMAEIVAVNPELPEDRFVFQAAKIVNEKTGTTTETLTRDGAGAHGARCHVLFLSELSHISDEESALTWLDNAAKMPSNLTFVTSNAPIEGTWNYRWRQQFMTSANWTCHRYAQPAPWLDAVDLQEAELRNTRARFRRLFWGEPSREGGEGIPIDQLNSAFVPGLQPIEKFSPDIAFVACGVDLSLRRDRTSLVAIGFMPGEGIFRVLTHRTWQPRPGVPVDLAEVREEIFKLHFGIGIDLLQADEWQASLLLSDLAANGINAVPVTFAGKTLDRLATNLLTLFAEGRVKIYDDKSLRESLQAVRIEERAWGLKLSAVRNTKAGESHHADEGIATAVALDGACSLIEQNYSRFTGRFVDSFGDRRSVIESMTDESWLHQQLGY